MHVGVVHTIRNQEQWDQVVRTMDLTALPEGIELLATGTSTGTDRAICLWRAPSVEALQNMLDAALGDAAVNDCFAVTEDSVYLAAASHAAAI